MDELYSHPMNIHPSAGADPGFLKGGPGGTILGLQAKKGGGGSKRGPNVKKPTSWPKGGGGPDPLDPPPPWIRYCIDSHHGLSI